MFRRKAVDRKPRGARFRPESLEPRVELTGGGNSVVAHAEAVVNRLSGHAEVRVEQLAAGIESRTVKFDAAYQAALANSAGGRGHDAFGRIDQFYLALERNTGRSVHELMAQVDRVAGGHSPLDQTIRAADPSAAARFDQALASVGTAMEGQVRSARTAAQALVAQATPDAAQVAAARASLATTAQGEAAGDRSDVQGFLAGFQQATTSLLDELAARAIQDSGSTGPTLGITTRSHSVRPPSTITISRFGYGSAFEGQGAFAYGGTSAFGYAGFDGLGPLL